MGPLLPVKNVYEKRPGGPRKVAQAECSPGGANEAWVRPKKECGPEGHPNLLGWKCLFEIDKAHLRFMARLSILWNPLLRSDMVFYGFNEFESLGFVLGCIDIIDDVLLRFQVRSHKFFRCLIRIYCVI